MFFLCLIITNADVACQLSDQAEIKEVKKRSARIDTPCTLYIEYLASGH